MTLQRDAQRHAGLLRGLDALLRAMGAEAREDIADRLVADLEALVAELETQTNREEVR